MFFLHLPVAGVEVFWPGIILLGATIGFLTGMFGVGGGFLLTPLLNIFFGIPFPVAVGSSLLQIFITSLLSSWKHWKNGNVDHVLGLVMALGAFAGTELGIRTLEALGRGNEVLVNGRLFEALNIVLPFIYLILMVSIAVFIFIETSKKHTNEGPTRAALALRKVNLPPVIPFRKCGIERISLWIPVTISILVGFLTGLLGVGGGFVNFPLLVYIIGIPTHLAVGTSSFQVLFATAYGSFRNVLQNNIEYILVAMSTVGSLVGVQLGVAAVKKIGGREVRRYFSYVIALGVLIIIGDLVNRIFL